MAVFTSLGASRVARLTCQVSAQPPNSNLNAAAAEVTTQRVTEDAECGRKPRRPSLGGCQQGLSGKAAPREEMHD